MIEASPDEIDNGIHYYFAEAELLNQGYEEPFVHFDEDESPPFLHAASRRHLDPATASIKQIAGMSVVDFMIAIDHTKKAGDCPANP